MNSNITKIHIYITFCLLIIINISIIFLYHTFIVPDNTDKNKPTYTLTNINDIYNEVTESRQTAITKAVSIVEPTVVSVNVLKVINVRRHANPFLDHFFNELFSVPLRREIQNIGSGVIFTDDGYIITNSHVVDGATEIKIVLTDATEYDAKLIGQDRLHDIAIIKIEANSLPYARLGTSVDLFLGEWAIAVGNPFGFLMKDSKPSVSVGVISALQRNITDSSVEKVYKGMIQTDAAINPGNSGGPLVNVLGEVVGINSFIFSQSGGSIGIGFAIPIDRVKMIADELISYGRIREVHIGLLIQDINPLMAHYLQLRSTDGVMVANVDNNSPAQKANLKKGDIITSFNDQHISNSRDIELIMADVKPHDKLNITVIREGKEHNVVLIAGEYI